MSTLSVSFLEGTNASDSPSKFFNHSAPHSSTKYDLYKRRGELRFNMHKKSTVIPYDDFMARFLPTRRPRTSTRGPKKSEPSNIFCGIASPSNEGDMYDTLPEVLNKSGLCPGHKFVATPSKRDPADPTKQSVDLGMYPKKRAPKQPSDGSTARMDWASVDIPMECKDHPTEEDPFDDDAPDAMPTAAKRKAAFGQLLSYAELIYRYQQREHVFLMSFLGDFVRIIRIDHSGLFATKKFNYKEEGEKVADFLWRFSRMTPVQRGHDSTALRIKPTSQLGCEMRRVAQPPKVVDECDYIRAAFKKSLDPNWPWWRLQVPVIENEGTPNEKRVVKRFLVGKPHFQAPGVAGRATRGYVALPVTASGKVHGPFVYLKDAWRVDRDGIEQEGSILRELNGLAIPYVPTLVCHGDIPGQVTTSQDIWPDYHPGEADSPLKRHQHYRLVVKEVGKPLDQFKNGVELVFAIACCIDAHEAAYRYGIIHRDISAGNILLYYDPKKGGWYGMLNDWELSKRVPGGAVFAARQPDRTGTWQFMSAHALNDRFRAIVTQDELESFFHVLLFMAIRFLPHNLPDSLVGRFLYGYFDDYTDGEHFTCGPMKFGAMTTGEINITLLIRGNDDASKASSGNVLLKFTRPSSTADHPIQKIIVTLLDWFAAYYALDDPTPPPSDASSPSPSPTKEAKAVIPQGVYAWMQKHQDPEERESAQSPDESSPPSPLASGMTALNPPLEPSPSIQHTAQARRKVTNPLDAKKLESHRDILKLFVSVLGQKEGWPDADKTKDKRPKGGYEPPKDPVPACLTTQTSGSKRAHADPKTPNKRSRA